MIRSAVLCTLLIAPLLAAGSAAGAPAVAGDLRTPTQEEKDFYASVVLPAMTVVKRAMPSVPLGWTVESETPVPSSLPDLIAGDPGKLWFSYAITYKRTAADIERDRKRLDESIAEARKTIESENAARTTELTKQRLETENALAKTANRKNQADEKRLRKELDEINGKLLALAEESEKAVIRETEEHLVRDTSFTVRVTINATTASFPDARYFSRPKAAYALKKEGGRVGLTGWKPDQVLLLYGDWEDARQDTFRGKAELRPFSSRVRTIAIMMEGDPLRMDQFYKHAGMRDLLGMMK